MNHSWIIHEKVHELAHDTTQESAICRNGLIIHEDVHELIQDITNFKFVHELPFVVHGLFMKMFMN